MMKHSIHDTVQNTFILRYERSGALQEIIGNTIFGERIVAQGNSMYRDTLIYYQPSSAGKPAPMPIRKFVLSGGKVTPLSGKGPSKSLAKKLRQFAYDGYKYADISGEKIVCQAA